MIDERRRLVRAALWLGDMAAVTAAFLTSYVLRAHALTPLLGPIYPLDIQAPVLLLALPVWTVTFVAAGLYRALPARLDWRETGVVAKATVLATLVLAAGIVGLKLILVSRVVVAGFVALSLPFVLVLRALVRRFVLNGATRRYVAIAGAHDRAVEAARLLAGHQEWGLTLAGFVADDTWPAAPGDLPAPVLGSDTGLADILHRHVVDQVLIVPSPTPVHLARLNALLDRCRESGVMARVALTFVAPGGNHLALERFGGLPLLTYSSAPADELLLGVRRVLDILLATAAVVVLSPLMLLVALAIKVTSPGGPIFYRQTRAGLRGRQFEVLKFRSMVPGAETLKPALEPYNEMDGPAFKIANDPRVTAIGAFLRRTSIDELPQLWNVLRGNMSWVGPRPVPVEEAARYEPWQRRRLSMKPGLTCLWQVSGRNELSFDEWMRLDLEYIDNWSLWLDAKILLKTIPAVLSGRGAR